MAQPGSYFCSNNFQVLSVTNFCCLPGWQTLGPFRFSARVLREAFLDLLGQSMVFSPIPKFDRFVWRHLGPSVLGKSAWEVGSQSISMKRSLNDRIFSAPNGGGLRKAFNKTTKKRPLEFLLNYFEKTLPRILKNGNSVYCSPPDSQHGDGSRSIFLTWSLHGASGCT